MPIQKIIRKIRSTISKKQRIKLTINWFLIRHFNQEQKEFIIRTGDPVRYGVIILAIQSIYKEKIAGNIAECGVYKGYTSAILRREFVDRKLYLFDTFEGFDPRDSDTVKDSRFKDTSVENVIKTIGTKKDIEIRKGFFPETAVGLDNEEFCFVMIDFDKYEPTLEALKFFYPKVSKGGYIFVHDYNNPESNFACKKALNEFAQGIPEQIITIPDSWGTAFFRKMKNI